MVQLWVFVLKKVYPSAYMNQRELALGLGTSGMTLKYWLSTETNLDRFETKLKRRGIVLHPACIYPGSTYPDAVSTIRDSTQVISCHSVPRCYTSAQTLATQMFSVARILTRILGTGIGYSGCIPADLYKDVCAYGTGSS